MSESVLEAVRSGNVSLLERLISKGCPTDIQDNNGWSALHLAVSTNNLECMRLLVSNGADPNVQGPFKKTALLLAIEHENMDMVGELLRNGADVKIKRLTGSTPLHVAVKNNSLDILQLLIEHGGCINDKDIEGNTPLHVAVEMGLVDCTKLLLESGADPNILGCYWRPPLHYTLFRNHITRISSTPLHVAVKNNSLDILQLLIEHGAGINYRDKEGNTPLHVAAEMGLIGCTNLLLELGADPNLFGCYHEPPLHHAVLGNHIPIIKILLPLTSHESMYKCGLSTFYSITRPDKDITPLKLLIDAGYSLTECRDPLCRTENILCDAFPVLKKLKAAPLTTFILDKAPSDLCNFLLNKRICYSSIAPNEFPPLLAALIKNDIPMASHLIKNGASINVYLSNYPFNMSLFACTTQEALKMMLRLGAEVKSLFLVKSVELFTEIFCNGEPHIRRHLMWVVCQCLHHHRMTPLPSELEPHLSQKYPDIISQYPIVRSLQEICKRTILSCLHPEHIIDGLQCLKPLPDSIINDLLHVDLIDCYNDEDDEDDDSFW